MSQYAIVFRFELDNGSAASLNADLKIADSNTISLAGGLIQIQPYGTSATPPLAYCNVGSSEIKFQADASASADKQSIQIGAHINAVAATMTMRVTVNGTAPMMSYQFPGTSSQGALVIGSNVIAFPE